MYIYICIIYVYVYVYVYIDRQIYIYKIDIHTHTIFLDGDFVGTITIFESLVAHVDVASGRMVDCPKDLSVPQRWHEKQRGMQQETWSVQYSMVGDGNLDGIFQQRYGQLQGWGWALRIVVKRICIQKNYNSENILIYDIYLYIYIFTY